MWIARKTYKMLEGKIKEQDETIESLRKDLKSLTDRHNEYVRGCVETKIASYESEIRKLKEDLASAQRNFVKLTEYLYKDRLAKCSSIPELKETLKNE